MSTLTTCVIIEFYEKHSTWEEVEETLRELTSKREPLKNPLDYIFTCTDFLNCIIFVLQLYGVKCIKNIERVPELLQACYNESLVNGRQNLYPVKIFKHALDEDQTDKDVVWKYFTSEIDSFFPIRNGSLRSLDFSLRPNLHLDNIKHELNLHPNYLVPVIEISKDLLQKLIQG